MMRLLDRTKSHRSTRSKAAKSPEESLPVHASMSQARPSLQLFENTSRLRSDKATRPQTADDGRHAKLARMSFFEAFAIDAGDDTFAFPKPSSAKTIPKDVERLASIVSSSEASPMIGIAFGSPSNPPYCWTSYASFGPGSTNATPRTPRFTESFAAEPMPISDQRLSAQTTAWKKVGNLFRRATRISNREPTTTTAGVTVPEIYSDAQRPSTSNNSVRPRSRGRTTLLRDRKTNATSKGTVGSKVDLGVNHVLRSTEIKVTSKTARSTRSMKQPRGSYTDKAAMRIEVPLIYDRPIPLRAQSTPAPRLELQVPSYHLERYSVMFETVLDPKPSLLERRKSRLRILNTNYEESASDLASTSAKDTDGWKPLTRSATSPSLQPALAAREKAGLAQRQQTRVMNFHKPLPPLQRHNTTPQLRLSPLRNDFDAPQAHPPALKTFYNSPISVSEDEDPFPRTPPLSGETAHTVHVVTDLHMDESGTNVWHAVLPAPPGSSTSSRFSIDVYNAFGSPRLFSRSRSLNEKDDAPRPTIRQVQVAVARKVSMSQLINTTEQGKHSSVKPKMIQVSAQAHSRKTSVLHTNDERNLWPTDVGAYK